jgi:hypothetical protein
VYITVNDRVLHFHKEDLGNLLSSFVDSSPLCSLVSYFVRAESTLHVQEFKEQIAIAFDKPLWYMDIVLPLHDELAVHDYIEVAEVLQL